jgi:hypothetical protein
MSRDDVGELRAVNSKGGRISDLDFNKRIGDVDVNEEMPLGIIASP